MINFWCGELHYLTGFENNRGDGEGVAFNLILSNGDRSTQRDYHRPTEFTHMMPADALKNVRSVIIQYSNYIRGFSFFDKDRKLLWDIGTTTL